MKEFIKDKVYYYAEIDAFTEIIPVYVYGRHDPLGNIHHISNVEPSHNWAGIRLGATARLFDTYDEAQTYHIELANTLQQEMMDEIHTTQDLLYFLFTNDVSKTCGHSDPNARIAALKRMKEFGFDTDHIKV